MMCERLSDLWLEILSVRGIGAHRWIPVVSRLGPAAVVEMLRTRSGRGELSRELGRRLGRPIEGYGPEQRMRAESEGCTIVSISESAYPSLLREIPDPPPLLYCKGRIEILDLPSICIVGSRSADRRGIVIARALAGGLSRSGLPVVSGLARGIDSSAHEGGLEGAGSTCAVLGSGIDVVYPPENGELAGRIARLGLVISELPFGTPPLKANFPRRNRILSGISLGVVVVQAGTRSGAMVTARFAREHNRELFAVPGPVENALSRGPHALLKQGAYLVESVQDILDALPPCGSISEAPAIEGEEASLTGSERVIVDVMGLNPKHIDEIAQNCNISPTSILPLMLSLEMRGIIVSCGGNTYALPAILHDRRSTGPR